MALALWASKQAFDAEGESCSARWQPQSVQGGGAPLGTLRTRRRPENPPSRPTAQKAEEHSIPPMHCQPRHLSLALVLLVLCGASAAQAAYAPDLIESLPGIDLSAVSFKQYSGFVTVDKSAGRHLFYWLQESARDPTHDPLVLWLSGGPACSSVAAAMTEQGAFRPMPDGTLAMNKYAWNNVANVVFLESPAGTGFSYSETPSDLATGDARTANDTYVFLQGFLDRFPEYRTRPFFITGESYGGHYTWQMAELILKENQKPDAGRRINLQGLAVGNPWTDPEFDNKFSAVDWWTHALISTATMDGILQNCDFRNIGPLSDAAADSAVRNSTALCNQFLDEASTAMASIDIYQILEDICLSSAPAGSVGKRKSPMGYHFLRQRFAAAFGAAADQSSGGIGSNKFAPQPAPPCIDDWTTTYMNRADVQKAMHAHLYGIKEWQECSDAVQYSQRDLFTSVVPVWREVIAAKSLRLLILSGDIDGIVSFEGTRAIIENELRPAVRKPWRPWMLDGQVGGYVTEYEDGLWFSTVRGAGHMIPSVRPDRSLYVISKFLSNEPF